MRKQNLNFDKILDKNPKLYFKLQLQRLIELIRQGKIDEALNFAQEELAPISEKNKEFLEDIEKTMSLLAFESVENSPLKDLLDDSQRQKTASEVNAAILESQSQEKSLFSRQFPLYCIHIFVDPKLPNLLNILEWA